MNRKYFFPVVLLVIFSGFSIIHFTITPDNISTQLKWAAKAGAKKTPHRKKVFNVSSFGARNDGTTLNTKPIQAAIDACASKGGGMVTFDTGSFVTEFFIY